MECVRLLWRRPLAMMPNHNGFHPSEKQPQPDPGATVAVLAGPPSPPAPRAAARAGPDAGPAALRNAGLLERLHTARVAALDWGDVPVPAPDPATAGLVRNQAAFATLTTRVTERVSAALDNGLLPLVLGGDHSISLG